MVERRKDEWIWEGTEGMIRWKGVWLGGGLTRLLMGEWADELRAEWCQNDGSTFVLVYISNVWNNTIIISRRSEYFPFLLVTSVMFGIKGPDKNRTGAQIPGAKSPWQLNFLQRCLIFVVWNLLWVTLLTPKILKWLLQSWTICASLVKFVQIQHSTLVSRPLSVTNGCWLNIFCNRSQY